MIKALLCDAQAEAQTVQGRHLKSLFIGGGTPSLFTGRAIAQLLDGLSKLFVWQPDIEITLEANPGTVDASHFKAYRRAGINRLSLGVQSFQDRYLRALRRIHDAAQARRAFAVARQAGFENINLDLMFGLPEQTLHDALADLEMALALAPEHVSWYQLTLEPNTVFHRMPPALPDEDTLYSMHEQGRDRLVQAGYTHYEISAYAKTGRQCQHNLNYWRFGDYLGIGAGAHGKVSTAQGILRYYKPRHPKNYLENPKRQGLKYLTLDDVRLESMMNVLRLQKGVPTATVYAHTGLAEQDFSAAIGRACRDGLLQNWPQRFQTTDQGRNFLNRLLTYFM